MAKHAHIMTTLERRTQGRAICPPPLAYATPPMIVPIHPDAELIRLCARHDALELQYRGLFETITDDDERDVQLALIDAVQDDLLPRILGLQATTYPGWMARVRTMCLSDPQVAPDAIDTLATSPYSNERQMAALIRDLVAHAGIAA